MAIGKIEIIITIVFKALCFFHVRIRQPWPGYECAWKHEFFVLLKAYIVELENESGTSLDIK